MKVREPFLHGLRLWRQGVRSWCLELSAILVLAAAIALVTTLLDASGGLAPRLVATPIPFGAWAQSWTSGMRPPSAEQEIAVGQWSATAALIAGLLGLLAIGTLAGARAQRRRANRFRDHVTWSLGAGRRQRLAERVGEVAVWAVVAVAGSAGVVAVIPALVGGTFPGALGPGKGPAFFAGVALVVLLAASLAGERSAIVDARHSLAPFRPIAAGLQSPAFLIGLGFAVASSAGLLLLHSDGPRLAVGGGGGVQVLRASVLPRFADGRAAILREWLLTPQGERRVGAASTGTLRGIGVRDIAWVDCGACSSGGLPTPIKVVRPELFAVGPDTFPLLGVEVVEGRAFESGNAADGPPEAIVSRRMARANFEGGRAVGRRLRIGDIDENWLTVVGVVTDRSDASGGNAFAVYLSLETAAPAEVELLSPSGSGTLARLAISAPAGVELGEAHSGRSEYAGRRWFAVLFGMLAAICLLLITSGGRRAAARDARAHRLEVAVRRAVGARRRHVFLFLAARIGWQVAVGLGIGMFLSIGVAAKLQRAAADLPIVDMRIWAVAGLLVLGASLSGFHSEARLTLLEAPASGIDGV